MVEEYNSEDDDEEEENFAWYDLRDKNTYFVLNTMNKNTYKKDDQVFHCYGRRSNQYLLANYGFVLQNNKYNSLRFKVNIDFNWKQNKQNNLKTDDSKVSKLIKLKEHKLKDEIFAYIRANLIS